MKKVRITLQLIFLLAIGNALGQRHAVKIGIDSVASRYLKGDLIVINNCALFGPVSFFDSVKITPGSYTITGMPKDSAIARYGYFGAKRDVYEMTVMSMERADCGYFVDAGVLKYIDPEHEMFYFVDGAPCRDWRNVFDLIVNKKVKNIQQVDAKGASLIWGPKTGKNGAVVIDTDKKASTLTIIP